MTELARDLYEPTLPHKYRGPYALAAVFALLVVLWSQVMVPAHTFNPDTGFTIENTSSILSQKPTSR